MTQLADLFPLADLDFAIRERLVVARRHPECALTILNYSDRCQYEAGHWSTVTRACRGLIHDDNGAVVARPFRKFFNYGQAEAPQLSLDEFVTVTDKLDGSLGILYRSHDGWAIATRGSFESEQAIHATRVLRQRYADFLPPEGWTLLFEILFANNRIVVDYGDLDDLVLLGAVNIADGGSIDPFHIALRFWSGPKAHVFQCDNVAAALAMMPRKNAEGIVLQTLYDERVKIKQEDYIALHKIVCGLNERVIWQHFMDEKPLIDLVNGLPDEFHPWVGEVATRLLATVEGTVADVERAYSAILAGLPTDFSRKDFAIDVAQDKYRPLLFLRHDGKDIRPSIWRAIKPSAFRGPRGLAPSEVTA